MYTSVLFIYSLQIFGYDSLWYNCSIVIIFYFPCISMFYSFVCSSHLYILSYMNVPYGAFFINKEFEFEFGFNNIYTLELSILPLSQIFRLDFGTVPTVWYFFFILLIIL